MRRNFICLMLVIIMALVYRSAPFMVLADDEKREYGEKGQGKEWNGRLMKA